MNDKEYNIQKKRLHNLTTKWIAPLGLKWWTLKLCYSRESLSTEAHVAEGNICQATTKVDWEYLNATITFDMQAISLLSDSELEDVFVHECCHILIHETRQWAENELPYSKRCEGMKHEERVVTQLAKAFIWVREDGEETFKKLHPKSKPKAKKIKK